MGKPGQEIPVCFPLKPSKTEAEEMRVTGDQEHEDLPSVEWGPPVPKLSGDKGSASWRLGSRTVSETTIC